MAKREVVWCVQFRERYPNGRWSAWKFLMLADHHAHACRLAKDWADSMQQCRAWPYEPRKS
jgi:hypothetical protein